jgi:DNA-binding transcriptional LysR family regulator
LLFYYIIFAKKGLMLIWQGLEEFIQVAEKGSFTKAAKALDVSVSHISRQLTQLEARLGVRLINRTTRKVTLTEAGNEYALRLKNIRHELFAATDQLQGVQQAPQGLIRLSGAGHFVAHEIVPLLTAFVKKYPLVQIDLNFTGRNIDLVEEDVDLAIRFGRMQDSNLIARPLTSRAMSLIASKAYLQKNGCPTSLDDLKHHNCLVAISNRWRFIEQGKIKEIKVQGNWKSNNAEAIKQACLHDLGIAHLAKDLVHEEVRKGELVYLLDEFQVKDNATWLVYLKKDLIPHRVRLLIDFLLDNIK